MFRSCHCVLAGIGLTAALTSSVVAQAEPLEVREETPGLLKLAKVSAAGATKIAQARFPAATIKSGEIEKEHGKLIYTFDIQQPGVKGTEEVNIDAMTGVVVATQHEDPAPPKKAPKPPVKKPPTG